MVHSTANLSIVVTAVETLVAVRQGIRAATVKITIVRVRVVDNWFTGCSNKEAFVIQQAVDATAVILTKC